MFVRNPVGYFFYFSNLLSGTGMTEFSQKSNIQHTSTEIFKNHAHMTNTLMLNCFGQYKMVGIDPEDNYIKAVVCLLQI